MLRPLLVLSALLAAGLAQAGYTVSYSGGTATYTSGTTTSTSDYSLKAVDGSWGETTGRRTSCTGLITATFSWQTDPRKPNETAPSAVLVTQGCIVEQGDGGSCNNGFNDPLVGNRRGENSPGSGYPISHYSVKQGANGSPLQKFTVTCSPSASGTYGGAIVRYRASASPLTLTVGGSVTSGVSPRTVVGCKVTGSVSGATGNSTYVWSVSGGDPFASYQYSNSAASVTGWATQNQPSTSVVFKKPDTATVSCHVTDSSQNIDVTLTKSVVVTAPSFSIVRNTLGSFILLPNAANATGLALADTSNPNVLDDGKITIQSVVNPQVLVNIGSPGADVQNIQTMTADYQRILSDGTTYQGGIINGVLGLDKQAPAGNPSYANPPEGGSFTLEFRDSPGDSALGNADLIGVRVKADAHLYLMYRPVTGGAQWVSIAKLDWSFYGRAVRTGSTPAWQNLSSAADNSNGSMSVWRVHPVWTVNINP